MNTKVELIANEKCWIEHTALTQLHNLATLKGVTRVVGLPDLHAGTMPVGVTVETKDVIYPHLIGGDIGCGMGLFQTNCPMRKFKQNRFVTKLNHIRALEDLEAENPFPEESPIYDLGTIGGGNHFAEFQTVEEIYDEDAFDSLEMDKKQLFLLIHSGSRNYGQRILDEYLDFSGLDPNSPKGKEYLLKQEDALLWAQRNRKIVAKTLVDYLGYSSNNQRIVDCHHNFLETKEDVFVHRKGTISTKNGIVIIPGSRGTLTYLVKPKEDTEHSADSLSHGAGRKWARSICKSRIKNKYDRNTIRQTKLGSRTICHDSNLLYQEAPEAYKNIEHVIGALVEHNLCTVVATMRPLITYKG